MHKPACAGGFGDSVYREHYGTRCRNLAKNIGWGIGFKPYP